MVPEALFHLVYLGYLEALVVQFLPEFPVVLGVLAVLQVLVDQFHPVDLVDLECQLHHQDLSPMMNMFQNQYDLLHVHAIHLSQDYKK
ncbi:MAG: hypothetical protein EBS68_17060 [Rhodobacteraceae bacterium]|nr:hypothetical protein [Paracoccaceae bacterium]